MTTVQQSPHKASQEMEYTRCPTPRRYVSSWRTSADATVRLRTYRTKGPGSRKAGLAMAFKLAKKAEKGWRKPNGSEKLQDLIDGVVFVDGVKKAA